MKAVEKCLSVVTEDDARRVLDALFLGETVVITDVGGRIRRTSATLDVIPTEGGWSMAVVVQDPDLFTDISIVVEEGTKTDLRSYGDKSCACEASKHGSVCICVNPTILDLLLVLIDELGIAFVYRHPDSSEGMIALETKSRPRSAEEVRTILMSAAAAKLVHDCARSLENENGV